MATVLLKLDRHLQVAPRLSHAVPAGGGVVVWSRGLRRVAAQVGAGRAAGRGANGCGGARQLESLARLCLDTSHATVRPLAGPIQREVGGGCTRFMRGHGPA